MGKVWYAREAVCLQSLWNCKILIFFLIYRKHFICICTSFLKHEILYYLPNLVIVVVQKKKRSVLLKRKDLHHCVCYCTILIQERAYIYNWTDAIRIKQYCRVSKLQHRKEQMHFRICVMWRKNHVYRVVVPLNFIRRRDLL